MLRPGWGSATQPSLAWRMLLGARGASPESCCRPRPRCEGGAGSRGMRSAWCQAREFFM